MDRSHIPMDSHAKRTQVLWRALWHCFHRRKYSCNTIYRHVTRSIPNRRWAVSHQKNMWTSLTGVSGYIFIYNVMTSSSSSAFMFTNRSSSNPSHRMCSAGTPPSTRELMAISIKVDFPHLRTPGTVMIFFLFIGSFMSRFITSKGIYLFLPVNIWKFHEK